MIYIRAICVWLDGEEAKICTRIQVVFETLVIAFPGVEKYKLNVNLKTESL